jgi:phage replication O-like protein O
MEQSPQLEDGYTRLANELLDAFIRAGLTSRQWAVAMAIVRKTYGFNKKEDDLGLSQISEMTGIAKAHVSVAVRELEARRIITRKQGVFGHKLGINKHLKTWLAGVTKSVTGVTETVTVTDSVTGGYRIGIEGVTESVTPPVTESVTTKDNPSKDSQKTTPKDTLASQAMRNRFERFYAAYPKKKSRGTAEKAFAKLNPDEQLLADILAGIKRAMTSGEWDGAKFIPYPASWLNAKGWMDEMQTEYSETERAVIQAFNDALGEQLGTIDVKIFDGHRAFAIRTFLTLSEKPNFWVKFFPWVRDNTELPPHVGFDWLISRDGFTKVKGGQHTKRDAA